MKKLVFSSKSAGLTLIEMVTTITVIGIMVVGLAIGLRAIMFHYQDDTVLLEIRQYGQAVMREMMQEISKSRFISHQITSGYARIHLTQYDKLNNPRSVVISANALDGIKINGDFPAGGSLKLPRTGRFRDNRQRVVRLDKFTANEKIEIRPSLYRYSQATWDLELIFSLETDVRDDKPLKSRVRIKRTVFMPDKYITKGETPELTV